MKFIHEEALFAQYPNNYTKLILIEGLASTEQLELATKQLSSITNNRSLHQDKIVAWQKIYEQMNAKKKYVSSLQSLSDTYEETSDVSYPPFPDWVKNIVRFYNFYSIANGMPMAAYDADNVDGHITLKNFPKGALFSPLTNPKNTEPTKIKEVGYSDESDILCRYWNKQDCFKTKIKPATKNIIFIFDLYDESEESVKLISDKISTDFDEIFSELIIGTGLVGPNIGSEILI